MAINNTVSDKPPRLAYTLAEFSAACGRNPSWGYRLVYKGRIHVISDGVRLLIPQTEVAKFMGSAAPYDPRPTRRKRKEVGTPEAGRAQ